MQKQKLTAKDHFTLDDLVTPNPEIFGGIYLQPKGFTNHHPYAIEDIRGNELVVVNDAGISTTLHCTWFAVCNPDGEPLDKTPRNIT